VDKKTLLSKILEDINSGKEPRHTDYLESGVSQDDFVDVLEIAIDERFVKYV
jgi:hypothetical protein